MYINLYVEHSGIAIENDHKNSEYSLGSSTKYIPILLLVETRPSAEPLARAPITASAEGGRKGSCWIGRQ